MTTTRIPNIKVDDQKVELILRAIKAQLDRFQTYEDIEVLVSGKGVILVDELGGRWRVTINSLGNLVQTPI